MVESKVVSLKEVKEIYAKAQEVDHQQKKNIWKTALS